MQQASPTLFRSIILDPIQIINIPFWLVLLSQAWIKVCRFNAVLLDAVKECPPAQIQIVQGILGSKLLFGHVPTFFVDVQYVKVYNMSK
jgi:hypothetical protein